MTTEIVLTVAGFVAVIIIAWVSAVKKERRKK